MTCVPQPSQVNTESSRSEGGLVGVTEEKTNRPEQTGQGMIKDGNCEDATLCWSIQALQSNTYCAKFWTHLAGSQGFFVQCTHRVASRQKPPLQSRGAVGRE